MRRPHGWPTAGIRPCVRADTGDREHELLELIERADPEMERKRSDLGFFRPGRGITVESRGAQIVWLVGERGRTRGAPSTTDSDGVGTEPAAAGGV